MDVGHAPLLYDRTYVAMEERRNLVRAHKIATDEISCMLQENHVRQMS